MLLAHLQNMIKIEQQVVHLYHVYSPAKMWQVRNSNIIGYTTWPDERPPSDPTRDIRAFKAFTFKLLGWFCMVSRAKDANFGPAWLPNPMLGAAKKGA